MLGCTGANSLTIKQPSEISSCCDFVWQAENGPLGRDTRIVNEMFMDEIKYAMSGEEDNDNP